MIECVLYRTSLGKGHNSALELSEFGVLLAEEACYYLIFAAVSAEKIAQVHNAVNAVIVKHSLCVGIGLEFVVICGVEHKYGQRGAAKSLVGLKRGGVSGVKRDDEAYVCRLKGCYSRVKFALYSANGRADKLDSHIGQLLRGVGNVLVNHLSHLGRAFVVYLYVKGKKSRLRHFVHSFSPFIKIYRSSFLSVAYLLLTSARNFFALSQYTICASSLPPTSYIESSRYFACS